MGWRLRLIILGVGLLFLTGCYTKVPVQFDEPQNAAVEINGIYQGRTPLTLYMKPNARQPGVKGKRIVYDTSGRKYEGMLYVLDRVGHYRGENEVFVVSLSENQMADLDAGKTVCVRVYAAPPERGLAIQMELRRR